MKININQTQDLIAINLAGNFNARGSQKLALELASHKIVSNNQELQLLNSAKSKHIQIDLNELRYISAAGLSLLSVFFDPDANASYEIIANKNKHISSLLKYAFTGISLHGIEPAACPPALEIAE